MNLASGSDTEPLPDAPPEAPPPDAPGDASIRTVSYQIDCVQVSQEAFEALRATLEIEEGFSEGERMDGFTQIRKARVRGGKTRYRLVLDVSETHVSHRLTNVTNMRC